MAFHTFTHRINTHSRHQSGSRVVMTCTHFTQTHSYTSVKSASGQIPKTTADTVTSTHISHAHKGPGKMSPVYSYSTRPLLGKDVVYLNITDPSWSSSLKGFHSVDVFPLYCQTLPVWVGCC